jgi:hypothetical protein
MYSTRTARPAVDGQRRVEHRLASTAMNKDSAITGISDGSLRSKTAAARTPSARAARLLVVARVVLDDGGDEAQTIAALLHDAVGDGDIPVVATASVAPEPSARIGLDVFRLVTAVLAVLLVGMVFAASAGADMTWDQAAAEADFPVYEPTQTLGLKLSRLAIVACDARAMVGTPVAAEHGKRRSRRGWFSVTESFPVCGHAGAQRVVRRVTINRVNVEVAVNCPVTPCRVTAADGVRMGFRLRWRKGVTRRTFIDLRSRRLSLARVVASPEASPAST